MSRSTWYRDGLCFECTRCGNCCTGEPGTVRVSDQEIAGLADLLELAEHEFRAMYLRTLPSGTVSLRERSNHDCVFWDRDEGCRVYSRRPRQCRTWPFWQANVESPAHWENAASTCPGIGVGPVHSAETIQREIVDDGTLGTKPDLA